MAPVREALPSVTGADVRWLRDLRDARGSEWVELTLLAQLLDEVGPIAVPVAGDPPDGD